MMSARPGVAEDAHALSGHLHPSGVQGLDHERRGDTDFPLPHRGEAGEAGTAPERGVEASALPARGKRAAAHG